MKRISLSILALSLSLSSQAATFSFSMTAVTDCETTTTSSICDPVTEYRVYDVTGDNTLFVGGDANPSFTRNYPAQSNVEICFVATSYNGLESIPTSEVCVTPTIARPLPPELLNVVFN